MTKFFTLFLALFLALAVAEKTITLVEDGNGQSMSLVYKEPQPGETLRVQTVMQLQGTDALANGNASTVICVNTGSSDYTMADGASAEAFGVMFTCSNAAGCTDSQDVAVNFYGSAVTYASGTDSFEWSPSTRIDISAANFGNDRSTGTRVASTWSLASDYADWSNLPLIDQTAYLRCWAKFNVASADANINSVNTVSDWTNTENQSVAVVEADLTSVASSSSDGESNAFSPNLKNTIAIASGLMALAQVF